MTKVLYGVKQAKSFWSISLKHLLHSACGQPKETLSLKMIEVTYRYIWNCNCNWS